MVQRRHSPAAWRLGQRIKRAREQAKPPDGSAPTQRWLAQLTHRTTQQISAFENGNQLPVLSVLNQIYDIVRHEQVGTPPEPCELAQWLIDWLQARAEIDVPNCSENFILALSALAYPSDEDGRKPVDKPLCSLADFPGNDPLTIILGDRRESRAKSAADCLIYSGSMTDAMYLSCLGEKMKSAAIRSDKLLVRMPVDYLEDMPELAESNLLIIGSPAVNWGSRILNKNDAIFPFRIDHNVVTHDEQLRHNARMQDGTFAGVFWDLAQSDLGKQQDRTDAFERASNETDDPHLVAEAEKFAKNVLDGSTAKAVMNKFRTLGIIDPADQEHHAQITHSANDFAVVTLARNPYCKTGRYRAVICGGTHGPGTARALKELLSHPERFKNHPLGAVLEINLRLDLDWPTRFEKATISFQTREYTPDQVLTHFEAACGVDPSARSPVLAQLLTPEALESRITFVRQLVDESGEQPVQP